MRTFTLSPEKLRNLRYHRGWTQSDLAHKAGVSEKTVANAERGKPLYASTASLIAEALEVEPEALNTANALIYIADDPEKMAFAKFVARGFGMLLDDVLDRPDAAAVLGLSFLIARLTSLIEDFRKTAAYLDQWQQEINLETHLNDRCLVNFGHYFDRELTKFRIAIVESTNLFEPWPALQEIVHFLRTRTDAHIVRVEECLHSTKQHLGEEEIFERLQRARQISIHLREDLQNAADALEMKRDGMRNDFWSNALAYLSPSE